MADIPALLTVRGLDVHYGRAHALQGVSLTLPRGVLAVVGRNGMGKTTLCKAIMGLVGVSGGYHSWPAPRYSSWTSGSASISCGRPSLKMRPLCIIVTLSTTRSATSMSCSMMM